jgi:hypothetical protein
MCFFEKPACRIKKLYFTVNQKFGNILLTLIPKSCTFECYYQLNIA